MITHAQPVHRLVISDNPRGQKENSHVPLASSVHITPSGPMFAHLHQISLLLGLIKEPHTDILCYFFSVLFQFIPSVLHSAVNWCP